MLKLILFAVLPMATLLAPHKFYVSNTTIDHRPYKGTFEITMKIFTDDLEAALSARAGKPIVMSQGPSSTEQSTLIREYLESHFFIKSDGIKLIQNYVGKETEYDLTYVYLECTESSPPGIIEVTNRVLTEIYPDQINIVHFHFGGKKTTQALDIKTPSIEIRP